MKTLIRGAAMLAVAMVLSACASSGPNNTIADGVDAKLALGGHDPVGYFTAGKHLPGQAGIKTEYGGATYRFISDENRALFIKDPGKYAPQFGGFCANGIAYGIPWGGDADTWKIIDGKLYIFGGSSSMKYFLMDEKRNLELAAQYWRDEVAGGNAFLQRYKRLILRVPHYKTGSQLEAEWQARQNRKPPAGAIAQ
jgi:YHS domain-containing protein